MTFQLYDNANTATVGSPVTASIDGNGQVIGAPTLTLPTTAGTYRLRTGYGGNGYYKTSNTTPATIAVTAPANGPPVIACDYGFAHRL